MVLPSEAKPSGRLFVNFPVSESSEVEVCLGLTAPNYPIANRKINLTPCLPPEFLQSDHDFLLDKLVIPHFLHFVACVTTPMCEQSSEDLAEDCAAQQHQNNFPLVSYPVFTLR
jgi:hypothetical protein